MAVEIEAKMKVENFDAVRARLTEAGARRAGSHLETNAFFDTEDRSLLAADKGLRLRIARDRETGQEQYIVTFKGPRLEGPLKSREEIEIRVDSSEQATALLGAVGFDLVMSFEKRRESWTLGDVKVELDEVPHLGTFVEIEGPDEATVLKARETLGLSEQALVKGSYIGLLMAHLQEHGRPERHITFDALTDIPRAK